jgi:hypothetical protein
MGACERHGSADVVLLRGDVDGLAPAATALSEAAVVEHQCRQTGLREPPGVRQEQVHGLPEALCQHHAGQCLAGVVGQDEASAVLDAARRERDRCLRDHAMAFHCCVAPDRSSPE